LCTPPILLTASMPARPSDFVSLRGKETCLRIPYNPGICKTEVVMTAARMVRIVSAPILFNRFQLRVGLKF